jgi:uncharacterized protein (DUF952 family)
MNNQEFIVHICPRNVWEDAQERGVYWAPSSETEGFIHCSQPEQILRVANCFYQERPDLVLLWIDSHNVNAEIKYELGDEESKEEYPHIYGPLNIDAVIAIYDFVPEPDGVYKEIPGFVHFGND